MCRSKIKGEKNQDWIRNHRAEFIADCRNSSNSLPRRCAAGRSEEKKIRIESLIADCTNSLNSLPRQCAAVRSKEKKMRIGSEIKSQSRGQRSRSEQSIDPLSNFAVLRGITHVASPTNTMKILHSLQQILGKLGHRI